jgi:hypothetical protein
MHTWLAESSELTLALQLKKTWDGVHLEIAVLSPLFSGKLSPLDAQGKATAYGAATINDKRDDIAIVASRKLPPTKVVPRAQFHKYGFVLSAVWPVYCGNARPINLRRLLKIASLDL